MISQVHLGYESNSTMNPGKSTYELRFFDLIFLAAEISAALWVHIHFFETTLRTLIFDVLRIEYKSESWWLTSELLTNRDLVAISLTERRLKRQGRRITPFLIANNMSLSFWVELLGFRYYKKVWVHLEKVIPNYSGKREIFYEKSREIRNLRNSIAHHGPILRRNLLRDLTYLNELTSLLNPTLAIEVEKRSRALELIQNAQLVGSGGGI